MRFEVDPRPRLSAARLLAGAFGGAVGGLAFALVIAVAIIWRPATGENTVGALLGRLLGTDSPILVWGAHFAAAIVFGLVFAAFVAPRGTRRSVAWAAGYGVLLWVLVAFLGLRTITGAPLRFDLAALIDLGAHLAFGALLGVVYVAFFREEAIVAGERRATKA